MQNAVAATNKEEQRKNLRKNFQKGGFREKHTPISKGRHNFSCSFTSRIVKRLDENGVSTKVLKIINNLT